MISHYLLITLSLKCETACSFGIGRLFPGVIRTVVVATLSRNGSVCLICKAVECILTNIYTNPLGKTIAPCSCIIREGFFVWFYLNSLWELFS